MIDSGNIEREPAASLPDLLGRNARLYRDAPAVITQEAETSFRELLARAETLAAELHRHGIGAGDRVGLLQGNGLGFLECAFAIWRVGGVAVPFSTWSTPAELVFLLSDSEVVLVLAQRHFGERDFGADLAALPDVPEIRRAEPRVVYPAAQGGFAAALRALPAAASPAGGAQEATPEADAMILYTSGSTSRPKGVRLTQAGVCENGFHIGARQGLRPGDKVFLAAPLFWSFGGANALPAAFSHGAALVLTERFEPASALALIERVRCTVIYTLPAITSALLAHPGFSPRATESLRTGVTIGSAEDVRVAAERLAVPEICNIYGATETYGNCCVTWHHWPLEKRLVCQGPPLPGQDLRFRDPEAGRDVAPGEVGLVEVAGRISPGYTGASAGQNPEAFSPDGYYRTGDLGRLDPEGNFVFVGRGSEMIKRAGINVSPVEVEEAFQGLPGVAQCCVVGVPDKVRGEQIVAFVVPQAGITVAAEDLMRDARAVLSKYKLPDRIVLRDRLPLTATGKLMRKEVKKEALRVVQEAAG